MRADHQLRSRFEDAMDTAGDVLRIVVAELVTDDFRPEGGNLFQNHGGEAVLNAAVEHLVAGGDDTDLFRPEGKHTEDGSAGGGLFRTLHFALFDDEGDDAGAGQFIALFNGEIPMAGGDHHLPEGVYGQELAAVHLQETVDIGDELDLALFHGGGVHMLPGAQGVEDLRRVVFVEHVFIVFPDEDMILPQGEEERDILFGDDMALAEGRALFFAGNNLRDIMAEDLAHGLLCFHQFHGSDT